MPKGILGGPRPFSKEQLAILVRENQIYADFGVRGPLGGPRPFAKGNPLTEKDMEELLMDTSSAQEFREEVERRIENG